MNKPHKWAKEIKAWADGAEIEVKDIRSDWWTIPNPQWLESGDVEYRIKPQEQQSGCCCKQTCSAPKEPQYLYVYEDKNGFPVLGTNKYSGCIGKIKLETEDDVGMV